MAFFGLTALGPQDSFELSLVDFSYLQVFTDDDVKKAFKAADKNQRGHLDIHEVRQTSRHFRAGPANSTHQYTHCCVVSCLKTSFGLCNRVHSMYVWSSHIAEYGSTG